MNSFSKRNGLKTEAILQKHEMPPELRNRLWSSIRKFLDQYDSSRAYDEQWDSGGKIFVEKIFDEFFKLPLENFTGVPSEDIALIKNKFFDCDWNEIYDFIEFINSIDWITNNHFEKRVNNVLRQENAAFTFHKGKIIPLLPEAEIFAIDSAIQESNDLASNHLKCSYDFFTKRQKPDYRNCAKEAISALEAFIGTIAGTEKTLGDILKGKKFTHLDTHPALKEAIIKLYGYAGDKSGVRHSNKKSQPTVTAEEAWFILVTSSSIITYIKSILRSEKKK
ncbi:MAG: hypothetical protein SFW07_08230 [Gammaproteobacteria bacterium]|nr:hypothetical protein [Gammaproteobacteria bacterium]